MPTDIKKTILCALLLTIAFLSPSAAAPAAGADKEKPSAEMITINFVDVEISSIVRIMSEITGRNFIYDEGLKGRVTIVAPAKLTSDEALKLFVSALELKNFTLLPSAGAYKIVPSSLARQSAARVVEPGEKLDADDTYVVRLIPVRFIPTQEAYTLVQPLISRFGQLSLFGSRNALLVVDTAANVEKILEIISSVDVRADAPEIVYLKHAQAEVVAQLLQADSARGGARAPAAGARDEIIPDARLNAIILSGPLSTREYYRRFITLVDIPPPEASSRINVYYLENADAEALSKVLEALTSPIRAASGRAPGQPGQPALVQELTGRVSITPDKASNSLIIMASMADYNSLLTVIEKLDRRPKQVFVEAMITEVTVDKALELGTKWRITGERGGEPVIIGGVGTVDSSSISTILNGLAGLSLGGLGNFLTVPVTASDGTTTNLTAPGFAALFSLTEFRDAINVLSTPHILTSDNSEAEIVVGENVPFLSKIERDPSTTAQPLLQSIERKDVGIKLQIKPKISEGDFVKLDIYQEISAIATTSTAGASDLITTKRSAKTTVVVKNRQTVVIGGLIQTKETNNANKVPILGDIPILGWLFRFNQDRTEKTNLLVFITPYIIEDFKGLEDLKMKKEEEFSKESERSTSGKSTP